jgi:hypothetical protein
LVQLVRGLLANRSMAVLTKVWRLLTQRACQTVTGLTACQEDWKGGAPSGPHLPDYSWPGCWPASEKDNLEDRVEEAEKDNLLLTSSVVDNLSSGG